MHGESHILNSTPPDYATLRPMKRAGISLLLSWILCVCPVLLAAAEAAGAAPGTQPPASQKQTIQEKVIEIPAGSTVEVRLKGKEKLRGRLGDISPQGIVLQHAQGGKIEERNIAFDEVRSIKHIEKGMSLGAKIAVGALAGVGVFFLVLIAIFAAVE